MSGKPESNGFQNLVEKFKAMHGHAKRVVIDAVDGDLANFVVMRIAVHALGRERVVVLHHREHPKRIPSVMDEWGMRQGGDGAPTFTDLSGLLSQIVMPRPTYDLVGSDGFLRLDPVLWGKTPAAEELWDDAVAIVSKRMEAVVVCSHTSDDFINHDPGNRYGDPRILQGMKSGEVAQLALRLGYPVSSYMRWVMGELWSTRWNVVSPVPADRLQTVVCPTGRMEYVKIGFYEAAAAVVRATNGHNYGLMEADSARDFLRFLVLGEGEDEWQLGENVDTLHTTIRDIKDKEALLAYVRANRASSSYTT